MNQTLFAADQTWALAAILFGAGAFGLWAEGRGWARYFSGAVIAIAVTFAFSNLAVIPVAAPIYDWVWSYCVPFAIPLLLLRADLRRILGESGPMVGAFALGAVGTVLGVLLIYWLLPLPFGEDNWKLGGVFTATYVGGSMNFAATADALDLRAGAILSGAVAADNLVMTVFLLVLFLLPALNAFANRFSQSRSPFAENGDIRDPQDARLPIHELGLALAYAALVCALGFGFENVSGLRGSGVLVITALSVVFASLWPSRATAMAPSDGFGFLLMQVFFAPIGASANIAVAFEAGPVLFVFAFGILAIHLLFLLGLGRAFGLTLPELLIASNANLGGPTTAAAMAAAKGWSALVTPAVLVGTLGYVVATFSGVAVANLLRAIG